MPQDVNAIILLLAHTMTHTYTPNVNLVNDVNEYSDGKIIKTNF